MSTVIRPDTLRHVCKEPLNEVRSVQLRGRGIARLLGLDGCPNLTSLDISWNALTELDSACLEGCKEIWVVDASHNRLESIGGLSSVMALGYLNLSSNPLPLESLRPLAQTHILELYLGNDGSPEERRRTLSLLPNLWVLDEEFVTARERRIAEDSYHHAEKGGGGGIQLLLTRIDSLIPDKARGLQDHCDSRADMSASPEKVSSHHPLQRRNGPNGRSAYGDLERQGRNARGFFEDVLWRLPSRNGAAQRFRLATLLERYDQRAATANASAWVGKFTRGDVGGGVRGCVRRDWSLLMPRPHLEALLSLPVELKLDVAVLLAMRAAFRDSVPQQVLSEAFLVLLVTQEGLPNRMHSDLARIPAFICTALAHLLRSSILRLLEQASMPGRTDTTNPPMLEEHRRDLLDALPPVVTGVDVDNAFESWEISSWDPTCSHRGGGGSIRTATSPAAPAAVAAAAAATTVLETCESPVKSSESCSRQLASNRSTYTGRSAQPNIVLGEGAAVAIPDGTVVSAPASGTPEKDGDDGAAHSDPPVAHARPLGIGLARLCRRAVILLTRSPTCPDLVGWQPGAVEQRMYDQMEPLLARAHMSHRDLHPQSEISYEPGGNDRTASMTRSSSMLSCAHSPSTPKMNFDSFLAGRERGGLGPGKDCCSQQDVVQQQSGSVGNLRPPEAGSWEANIRRPRAGERVQVLHDVWAAIIVVNPHVFSIVVAPFDGMQAPPYRGQPLIDSRDLYYDPRGWWRHAPALTNTLPAAPGRLHRLARGLSASGLPWGAGSLNEPLEGIGVGRSSRVLSRCISDDERGREDVIDRPERGQQISYASRQEFTCASRAPTATSPQAPTAEALAASRVHPAASSNPSSLDSAILRHRCPNKDVVGVFSAEGSWDPVFVVAPARLVGLQNQTAAREMGSRRAMQVAWHRIEGPEASVAPRPMMPRCSSLATSAQAEGVRSPPLRQSASAPSIPGISDKRPPKRWASVAPRRESSSIFTRFARSRLSSVPSIDLSSCSTGAAGVPAPSAGDAWLDLQKEMGSLKADNRMLIRGGSQSGGTGTGRVSSAQALQRTSGSAMSVVTRSFAENSTVCAEATTDLLAKALSLGLDSPVSSWKRERPENDPTTVFELTQVDGKLEANTEGITVGACSTHVCEATPRSHNACEDKCQLGAVSPAKENSARAGAGEDTCALSKNFRSARCQRRRPQEGDSTWTITASTAWKPNVHRPLDWFPVPGRQVLLVDPNDVKGTATAAFAKVTAEREAATNSSEGGDLRPRGKGTGGDNCAQHWGEGRGGIQDPMVGERGPGDHSGSTRARKMEGGGGLGGDVKESRDRSEVALSARSGFPSPAVLADLLVSPANERHPEARARGPPGKCRSYFDESSPAARAEKARGCHNSDPPSNGVPSRNSFVPLDLTSHSVHEWPESKSEVGAQHRAKHVSANASHCHTRIPVALEVGANFNPSAATSEDRLRAFHSPDGWPGLGLGTEKGGKFDVGHVNAPRRRGPAAGATHTLVTIDGGLQINQLRPGPKASLAGAPPLVHETRNPAPGGAQLQSAITFGWKAGDNARGPRSRRRLPAFTSSKSGDRGSYGKMPSVAGGRSRRRFAPQGRGTMRSVAREHGGGGVSTRPASPWGSDTGLDECISISSTANSSINSCCGWMKTGSQT